MNNDNNSRGFCKNSSPLAGGLIMSPLFQMPISFPVPMKPLRHWLVVATVVPALLCRHCSPNKM
jgi:hypothetical protein